MSFIDGGKYYGGNTFLKEMSLKLGLTYPVREKDMKNSDPTLYPELLLGYL